MSQESFSNDSERHAVSLLQLGFLYDMVIFSFPFESHDRWVAKVHNDVSVTCDKVGTASGVVG